MERIVPSRPEKVEYVSGPVVLYLDDLEALNERIREALGDDCSFEVDIDGMGTQKPFAYTHRVSTFSELRDVLGSQLRRGFSIGDGKGEFRLSFDPILGFVAWAVGDRGMKALRIAEGVLGHKRRWFALFLSIPAWKHLGLYATLETGAMMLGERTLIQVAMVMGLWWLVILVQPEWSSGGCSKLWLVRPHERSVRENVTWKILAPLLVGGILLALRAWAAAVGII